MTAFPAYGPDAAHAELRRLVEAYGRLGWLAAVLAGGLLAWLWRARATAAGGAHALAYAWGLGAAAAYYAALSAYAWVVFARLETPTPEVLVPARQRLLGLTLALFGPCLLLVLFAALGTNPLDVLGSGGWGGPDKKRDSGR